MVNKDTTTRDNYVLGEVARAAADDEIITAGWDCFVTWSRVNPNRTPIDVVFPGWDLLSAEQQGVVQNLYETPSWSQLSVWQQDAFRKGFDLMLGRILMNAGRTI